MKNIHFRLAINRWRWGFTLTICLTDVGRYNCKVDEGASHSDASWPGLYIDVPFRPSVTKEICSRPERISNAICGWRWRDSNGFIAIGLLSFLNKSVDGYLLGLHCFDIVFERQLHDLLWSWKIPRTLARWLRCNDVLLSGYHILCAASSSTFAVATPSSASQSRLSNNLTFASPN